MAFTCGFFNSQNGDRKYNAEQMASIFDGLIKDGVYDTVGEIFAVTPGTGMQVLVGSGRAWFDHTWNNNDASYPLAITAADVSLPRYDAVVLETNHSDTVRTNRLRVVTGTPASNPVKPTMTSSANVKQHPLAYIKVTAGAKAITQSMIQVVVGTSECPFVTGIIDTAEIDSLFQQWNGEFNEWFENLKAQLSDNVVANLQAQIDKKVNKSDVATKADIEAGTSTTKWVTPKGLKEANINSDGSSVGDVLCTLRTNLDDDWVLCNGSIFSGSSYPKLNSLLSENIGYNKGTNTYLEESFSGTINVGQNTLSYIKELNGIVYIYSLDKGYLEKISVDISQYYSGYHVTSAGCKLSRLNNRYCLFGTITNNNVSKTFILTSLNLTSWTAASLPDNYYTYQLQMIWYRNAYYFFSFDWNSNYTGFAMNILKSTDGITFTRFYSASGSNALISVNSVQDKLIVIHSDSFVSIVKSYYRSSVEYYYIGQILHILNGDSINTNGSGGFSGYALRNVDSHRGLESIGEDSQNIYLYRYDNTNGYMTTIPKSGLNGGDVTATNGSLSINSQNYGLALYPWNKNGLYALKQIDATSGNLKYKIYNYTNSNFTEIATIGAKNNPNPNVFMANPENFLGLSTQMIIGTFSNIVPLISIDGCYSYIKAK